MYIEFWLHLPFAQMTEYWQEFLTRSTSLIEQILFDSQLSNSHKVNNQAQSELVFLWSIIISMAEEKIITRYSNFFYTILKHTLHQILMNTTIMFNF